MAVDQHRSVRYAQNFLKSAKLARRLIEQSGIDAHDLVIEIGPGTGRLTRELARRCRQVIAVEKDSLLVATLRHELAMLGNVALFEADALDLPLPATPYKVFANIPFNLTAGIVTKLLRSLNPPEEASLVMQREAAERFLGEPRETLVALLIKPWFEVSIAHWFRSTDFVPPPRVAVVLLRFSKRGPPLVAVEHTQEYRNFVTFGFTAWRATVREVVCELLPERALRQIAAEDGINLDRPPSAMSFADWLRLYRAFAEQSSPAARRAVAGAEERLRHHQRRLVKQHRTRTAQ